MTNPDTATETANYRIASIMPPDPKRTAYPTQWLFEVVGPGHRGKTYIAQDRCCGSHFMQALQDAYDAGVYAGLVRLYSMLLGRRWLTTRMVGAIRK